MPKKLIIVSISVLLVSGAIWYFLQNRSLLTITSPTGEYSVVLREDTLSRFLYETLIKFEVLKNRKEFVTSTYLDGYDGLEPGFINRFPSHAWIKDTALIFESRGHSYSGKSRFSIANESRRPVKYIRMTAKDILLLFDLMPGQKIEFAMAAQKHNKWMHLQGAFIDNSLFEKDFNFSGDDSNMELDSCYVIKILENDLEISKGSANLCED